MSTLADQLQSLPELLEQTTLEELSTELVLDLSSDQVAAARRAISPESDDLEALLFGSRYYSRHIVTRDGLAARFSSRTRADVRERIASALASALGGTGTRVAADFSGSLSDEIDDAAANHRFSAAPSDAVVLCFPRPTDFSARTRIGRRGVATLTCLPPADDERVITYRQVPVAYKLAVPGHFQMLVSPFVSNGSLSGASPDSKVAVLSEIIAQIASSRGSAEDAVGDELIDAVATVDLIIPFMRAIGSELQPRADTLQAELEQHERNAEAARQGLLANLREQHRIRGELDALDHAANSFGAEVLEQAIVELGRIRQNRCVKAVKISGEGADAAIDVTLHPLVLAYDGSNFIFDQMRFTMQLNGAGTLRPLWHRVEPSPHPHVSEGLTTCWGEAEGPISEALNRREFSNVVRFVCGWASIYNPNSPYVPINNFRRTTKEPGWHPELAVRV